VKTPFILNSVSASAFTIRAYLGRINCYFHLSYTLNFFSEITISSSFTAERAENAEASEKNSQGSQGPDLNRGRADLQSAACASPPPWLKIRENPFANIKNHQKFSVK
jgi:hypothetical protein